MSLSREAGCAEQATAVIGGPAGVADQPGNPASPKAYRDDQDRPPRVLCLRIRHRERLQSRPSHPRRHDAVLRAQSAGTLLGGDGFGVEDLAGLLSGDAGLTRGDLTGLFGGALVVDVGEIGGGEAAVVRFALGG